VAWTWRTSFPSRHRRCSHSPFDTDTFSTKAFEKARIEQWSDAVLPSLLIVVCGLVPVLLLDRLLERKR
jgi:ABC-type Fe3+ transport system permease subunit